MGSSPLEALVYHESSSKIKNAMDSTDFAGIWILVKSVKSIDFPIVNCAAIVVMSRSRVKTARISMNAMAVKPYQVVKAEKTIIGKQEDEALGEAAGTAALSEAKPMWCNGTIGQKAQTHAKRTIPACNEMTNDA
jgi:xanthine dehydrogenase YagS FAD-binding subunit